MKDWIAYYRYTKKWQFVPVLMSFNQEVAMLALGKNYRCVVARGCDEAIAAIRNYLG